MTDWTPETNRIQTVHLTADELAALKAAKWGLCVVENTGHLTDLGAGPPAWVSWLVYRAKPAPATKDVIRLRDCPMCHTAPSDEGVMLTSENLIDPKTGEEYGNIGYTVRCCMCGVSMSDEYRDEVVRLWNGEPVAPDDEADSLQQRPQPAATGAMTEPLAVGLRYWVADPTTKNWVFASRWASDALDIFRLKRGLVFLTEAEAVAAANRMTGGV